MNVWPYSWSIKQTEEEYIRGTWHDQRQTSGQASWRMLMTFIMLCAQLLENCSEHNSFQLILSFGQ